MGVTFLLVVGFLKYQFLQSNKLGLADFGNSSMISTVSSFFENGKVRCKGLHEAPV